MILEQQFHVIDWVLPGPGWEMGDGGWETARSVKLVGFVGRRVNQQEWRQ